MSRHNLGEKNMNNKCRYKIRKVLKRIVGHSHIFFEIKKGKFQDYGSGHAGINDPISVDGFYVEITDWNISDNEDAKIKIFNDLKKYFPNIEYMEDDILAHIPFGFDNFGEINA